MIRKIIGIAICFTAITTQAGAQGLGIELDGGLQGAHYQLQNGQSKLQPGGSFGLNYAFRLDTHWDLLTGVTGGIYRTQATLRDGIAFTSGQVDDGGSAFLYSVKATEYKETQRFYAASVPLLLQYHTTDAGIQWYFNGGGKVFAPFGSNIQVSASQLALSGYYPDFNVDISNLPQHGFGTVRSWKSTATTKLKPSAALSAATGVSFPLSTGMRLYAGLYVDYGLTGIKEKGDSTPFVTYNSTGLTGVKAGGVLNMPNAGKATLLSFGLQLRLSFGTARPPKDTERPSKRKEPQQEGRDSVGEEPRDVIEGSVVFGLLNEISIPEIQKKHLDEVADVMKRHPAIRISLVGHVCNSDTEEEDKKVGADRARSVAQYLRGKGIDAGRMDVDPNGVSDVFEPYNPLANYQSRRVVIMVK